jgi:hypothetical protein
VLHIFFAVMLAAAPTASPQQSPSVLAFAGSDAYGLHGCDPKVPPPDDSFVFCVSASSRNRTFRNAGDRIQNCHTARALRGTNGPALDPKTQLSFLVTRGSVSDLACELGSNLEVLATAQPDVATLELKNVHWRGLLEEAPHLSLRTDDGTVVILQVNYEKNTIALARYESVDSKP